MSKDHDIECEYRSCRTKATILYIDSHMGWHNRICKRHSKLKRYANGKQQPLFREGPITFTELREGNIAGAIDNRGIVHSHFAPYIQYHSELFPRMGSYWRWYYDTGITWFNRDNKPSPEQHDRIREHLTERYGIKFWSNGHHDLNFFQAQLKKEGARDE